MCDLVVDEFNLDTEGQDWSMWPIAEGEDFGNPDAIEREIDTFLRLGSVAFIEGWTNREWTVRVKITGKSGARAEGAAALRAALQRPKRLTITPCDGWGAATWFHIWTAKLEYETNDFHALQGEYEIYRVTLKLSPFGMAEDLFTVSATPGSFATAAVWDGATDPITGWSATNGTLVDSGVYMEVTGAASSALQQVTHATFGINATQSDVALTVDMNRSVVERAWLYNTTTATWVESSSGDYASPISGANRYLFTFPAGNYAGIRIGGLTTAVGGVLKVYKITLADNANSGRSFFVDTPGSAPTYASLTTSSTASLLLHTCEANGESAGYSPEPTASSNIAVASGTGKAFTMGTLPEGTYDVVALIGTPLSGSILDVAWDINGSGITLPDTAAVQGGRLLIDAPTAGGGADPFLAVVARGITLPDGATTMTVRVSANTAALTRIWVMWTGNPLTGTQAEYTIVTPATAGVIEIDAPTPERPRPRLLVGGSHNGKYIKAWGEHQFYGLMRVYVADQTLTSTPTSTLSCYPAFQQWAPPADRI